MPMIRALADPGPEVRREAIKALGYSESYRAIVPVARRLRDLDLGVRREAAIALGLLRDKRGIGPLLETLRDPGEKAEICSGALLSLIRLESEVTLGPLLDQMGDRKERTRFRAIGLLQSALREEQGTFRRPSAGKKVYSAPWTPGARSLMGPWAKKRISLFSAQAGPGKFPEEESVLLKRKEIIQSLAEAFRDSSPAVRREVVRTMARMKDPVLVPSLLEALTDRSEGVKKEAFQRITAFRLTFPCLWDSFLAGDKASLRSWNH
ncbi:MAG: HEAT repeat domain-containing protein [Candidatus Tectomicrobia bacterium]|uniref:HEAT repeat domain-containing protein n=1 Tax=Tectimicrobiota bacterium TaxID=2528274 RepID=A0A932FV77_UNCTE|nr:HEAT repeat domain-containing protein [Candidatus Tectomicrobia bacterium]